MEKNVYVIIYPLHALTWFFFFLLPGLNTDYVFQNSVQTILLMRYQTVYEFSLKWSAKAQRSTGTSYRPRGEYSVQIIYVYELFTRKNLRFSPEWHSCSIPFNGRKIRILLYKYRKFITIKIRRRIRIITFYFKKHIFKWT